MKPLRPLLGRTAVALVFVEGPGTAAMDESTRVSAYANTAAAQGVLGRLGAAWGARLNPPLSSPPATFALSGQRVPIGVDPRSLPGRTGDRGADWKAIDQVWLTATLDALGVPAIGTFDERMRKVGAALAAIGWQWLAVDDVVPVFMTNYPTHWDGYADGASRYATIDVRRVWATERGREHLVIAHELGHLFGAPDEYADSHCTVADTTGPFLTPNLNCTFVSRTPPVPNPLSGDCLMKNTTATACLATEATWGWVDADLDGEPDLLASPVITAVEPMAPAPGELVLLTGRNMWDVMEVDVGGTRTTDILYVTVDGGLHPLGEADGSVKYRTDQIQVRVPAGLDGIQLVSVRTRGNNWSPDDPDVFVAVTSSGPVIITEPVVQQLVPSVGPAGLEVTVKGEHLARVTAVTVGGTPAPNVQAWTGETVTFTVPARPPGPAQVVVSTPTESSLPWAFSVFTVL
ncbi:IPT/TIG domain-containing protein [Pseudonocardia alni]|uniref:IPT/TIG domain-containing protein n=1 Tax=Pseudonocardia alni TaxID=33907 RepID=UPI0033212896